MNPGKLCVVPCGEPIERTDEEVRTFLQDLVVKKLDPATREFFGVPIYVALIAFPHHSEALATWAANAAPEERGQLARAMVELMMRWGYKISDETLRGMGMLP